MGRGGRGQHGGERTCTIMVSTLSGLNLSLYLEREWARPMAIDFISEAEAASTRLSIWLRSPRVSCCALSSKTHGIPSFSLIAPPSFASATASVSCGGRRWRAGASRGRKRAEDGACGGLRWVGAGCGDPRLQLLGHDALLQELLHASAELALDKRRRRLHGLSGVLKLVEGLQLHPATA